LSLTINVRSIALVEERELQRAVICRQSLDGRRAQRREPVETGRGEVFADPCLGNHAAIAHKHHAGQAETFLKLLNLRG
jgi:hypothetical protein